MTVLKIKNLSIEIPTTIGPLTLVNNVTFKLGLGQILGLVGESGCGKTMTALALMGLLPDGAQASGEILLKGRNLVSLNESSRCKIRGRSIAMVFQEPMTALNPIKTIGDQILEPLLLHLSLDKGSAQAEVHKLMADVGLYDSKRIYSAYPHQLSGGERQRAMIAMALSCYPDVLIADEPTSALDVTVQAQILDLLYTTVSERKMSLLLISHDLGVIAENADQVMVMYAGALVERGSAVDVFTKLAHPYTQGLFGAVPRLGTSIDRLKAIPGSVPDPLSRKIGCAFYSRCPISEDHCFRETPKMVAVGKGHSAACAQLPISHVTESLSNASK